ncbi:homocysteine S-methyltransferase family protein [Sedimentisphaera salicampi]|uniref:Bifunctional homocysteine S-methyltransferase/5,10-methylenetetrahydrofolate reductase n=1 Tax=Sedimentisphaera salicampi TaxID=1941349 RepID=A0A1W6LJA7_9BACT|nr:homocysteine S-methyltransferase family protein [Sedimentisphaera salicampi]ARN55880.1 Bifunctional homocysteine S-methyltransferase/5,10-methylenetetrahydrofolate reductase [Sedimentisphaera salicampi]OXU16071.1 Bifunctional homocysteine S-methyltransferase/5,10-methylenetetrahydrofolate reductase [Sedimentisphaera salicampi]
MSRKKISEIAKTRILISDGAWGTYLQRKGLEPGECPEKWNLDKPDEVLDIAQSYANAGADMIGANSFGGSKLKLEHFGLSEQCFEINKAAAEISRKAAGEDKWVLGSLGPCGKMLLMGDVTEQQMYDSFAEQVKGLEAGGADAICVETMSDVQEASLAVKAAKDHTNCEVICTLTYERTTGGEYRTMMGIDPEAGTKAAIEAGADIVGTNCGNGFERMIDIVKQIKAVCGDKPILIHANAGLPENVDGVDVFPDTPEFMASLVKDIAQAGANVVGGCCGTTPEHINAIAQAAKDI